MSKLNLTNNELNKLIETHRNCSNKKIAYKLNALILLAKNYTYEEINDALLLDERTIRNWKNIYLKKGIEGILEENYKGKATKLNKNQIKILKENLNSRIFSTAAEVCLYVKKEFNINYTPDGMVILLHRIGFVYKKTKLVPGKADPEKQKEFVKKYKELKENKGKNTKIYFTDATHPTHNVMPAYAWIKKGTEKEVKSNTGRERVNINGAYSPDDNSIIYSIDKTVNAQSTIKLFKKIEKINNTSDKIYIISDNAKYYKARLLIDYLKHSKIEMIYLPPYSPNLNIIERLWKLLKKKILYNQYFSSYEDFVVAIKSFLNKKNLKHKNELQKLLTENFHIFGAV